MYFAFDFVPIGSTRIIIIIIFFYRIRYTQYFIRYRFLTTDTVHRWKARFRAQNPEVPHARDNNKLINLIENEVWLEPRWGEYPVNTYVLCTHELFFSTRYLW